MSELDAEPAFSAHFSASLEDCLTPRCQLGFSSLGLLGLLDGRCSASRNSLVASPPLHFYLRLSQLHLLSRKSQDVQLIMFLAHISPSTALGAGVNSAQGVFIEAILTAAVNLACSVRCGVVLILLS